jgi:hypothetical protein
MTSETTTFLNTTDEKALAAFRRLLLSKQLYLHGLDHSMKAGALNKMIAVHNFHNAIEIALRAIFLHYEIRAEKQLNIEFEVMLNEIDNYEAFKDKGVRLPYRQELRNLNQLRNLVQHHAVEPESTTMNDWQVLTRRFLEQACQTYFALEFASLSPLSMIEDVSLREVLRLSLLSIEEDNFKRSLTLSKIAFEWAGQAISGFLPYEGLLSSSVITSGFRKFPDLRDAFEKLAEKTRRAEYYAALLSSGVNLVDYKRFESSTPSVAFTVGGSPNVQSLGFPGISDDTARWAHNFVVTTIVHWQALGLAPCIPYWGEEAAEKLIREGGAAFS